MTDRGTSVERLCRGQRSCKNILLFQKSYIYCLNVYFTCQHTTLITLGASFRLNLVVDWSAKVIWEMLWQFYDNYIANQEICL